MTSEEKTLLEGAGYDVDGALARFVNNADLFMMFLKKIPGDEHFAPIKAQIESGDYAEAHKNAHAIKGVVGNLGMTPVFDASAILCTLLKAGDNADEIKAKYEIFAEEYDKAVQLISSL